MGTETTANLSLIKPDLSEPIPNFDTQNGFNMDTIDDYFAFTASSYVPVWTANGASNPSLGSGGQIFGKYLAVWPNVVIFWVRIFTGTTGFSAGDGTYSVTLPPFAAHALMVSSTGTGAAHILGKAILHDSTGVADSQTASVALNSTTTFMLTTEAGSGSSQWQHDDPFALSQSDRMACYGIYIRED